MQDTQTAILPDDPEWQELLRAKLRQYENRIERYDIGCEYYAPEQMGAPHYALMLLGKLLRDGSVDGHDYLQSLHGAVDERAYWGRFTVVRRYTLDIDFLRDQVALYKVRHGVA